MRHAKDDDQTPCTRWRVGARVDANFAWAELTGYRDFLRPGEPPPERIPVLIELAEGACVGALRQELTRLGAGEIPAAYPPTTRYCTAWITRPYARSVAAGQAGGLIRRFELCLPVIPGRAKPRPVRHVPKAGKASRAFLTETVLGVIDNGCPFAHSGLRTLNGRGTRVAALWDQDGVPSFATPAAGGMVPKHFGYGCEVGRRELDRLMSRRRVQAAVDEDGCYRDADYDALRERSVHGAATTLLFAGASRIGLRRSRSWPDALADDSQDYASLQDVVFVQLPRDAVQDSSSASLGRCLLDGLRYIVCAAETAKRLVVNISDGTSRGTHDGDSLIERAMADLVDELAADGRQLTLSLPAGNAFDERRHAQLAPWSSDGSASRLTMRLPPGNECPSFIEVRIPPEAKDLRIRLQPPAGAGHWLDASCGEADLWPRTEPVAGVVFPAQAAGSATAALLCFAPTLSTEPGKAIAPHGDWLIQLQWRRPLPQPVHFYITRNQTNLGALRRAQQPHFIDTEKGAPYDPNRELRSLEDDPSRTRAAIRRKGTLNGLATAAQRPGFVVVGGHHRVEQTMARYSADGPAAGAPVTRLQPDASAPSEVSRALRGITVSGSRSGDRVRLMGTSFAAPQVARAVANGEPLDRRYFLRRRRP